MNSHGLFNQLDLQSSAANRICLPNLLKKPSGGGLFGVTILVTTNQPSAGGADNLAMIIVLSPCFYYTQRLIEVQVFLLLRLCLVYV